MAGAASSSCSANNGVEFSKPTFVKGTYGNPKSFTKWTGLPGFFDLLKWRTTEADNSNIPTSPQQLDKTLPIHPVDVKAVESSDFTATWLGHATMLIRIDGVTVLTDPIWADRCSPVWFAGPKRYRPPPCEIEQLPKIDVVVISHNHYDHLDLESVKQLEQRSVRNAHGIRWFVPMGLKAWMMYNGGCDPVRVTEMTWGESGTLANGIGVHCVPAQHWSLRLPWDRFKTLWCGWAIVGPKHRFYFAGDTGFCEEEFDKIGRKLGPFDLAAIPIGCYEPRWFMKPQHIGPEEAIEVHRKVHAKRSVGIHWGTYNMGSTEFYLEPKQLLEQLVVKNNLKADEFVTFEHGKTYCYYE